MRQQASFRHDILASRSEKIELLLVDHGATGLGVYWSLVEELYQAGGICTLSKTIKRLAHRLATTLEVLRSVIMDYELFETDERADLFQSAGVNRRIREQMQTDAELYALHEKAEELARLQAGRRKRMRKAGALNASECTTSATSAHANAQPSALTSALSTPSAHNGVHLFASCDNECAQLGTLNTQECATTATSVTTVHTNAHNDAQLGAMNGAIAQPSAQLGALNASECTTTATTATTLHAIAHQSDANDTPDEKLKERKENPPLINPLKEKRENLSLYRAQNFENFEGAQALQMNTTTSDHGGAISPQAPTAISMAQTTPSDVKPSATQTATAKPSAGAGTSKRREAPTLAEVRAEILQKGYQIDAEAFWNFYEANGWTQGRGKPIKNWRACLVTWSRRDDERGGAFRSGAYHGAYHSGTYSRVDKPVLSVNDSYYD